MQAPLLLLLPAATHTHGTAVGAVKQLLGLVPSHSIPVDGLCFLLHKPLPEAEYAADQTRPAQRSGAQSTTAAQ
jgi:hypothetical protein